MSSCPQGKIRRSSFRRQSYTRKDGTQVEETFVPSTCVPDVGQKGKTPRNKRVLPPPDKEGSLRKYGYSTKNSTRQRRASLRRASRDIGSSLPVMRRLNLIANFNKWNPESEEIMRDDVQFLRNEYQKEKEQNTSRNQSRSNSRKKTNRQSRNYY